MGRRSDRSTLYVTRGTLSFADNFTCIMWNTPDSSVGLFREEAQKTWAGEARMSKTAQEYEHDQPAVHAHRTAKVIELVASSTKSWEDAVQHGIEDAAASTRGIRGCKVQNMSVKCSDGKITEYRVDLKLVFGIERTPNA